MRQKAGPGWSWGRERCDGDQMVFLFCETSLVLSTRSFPAPRTDLFFLNVFIFSSGKTAASKAGVSLPRGLGLSALGITDEGLPWPPADSAGPACLGSLRRSSR